VETELCHIEGLLYIWAVGMIEKWLSASSIAQLLGKNKRVINRRAKDESWSYRTFEGNGGPHPRYHIADLPEDVQRAYAASLKTSLEALQTELKPPSKAAVQHVISGYNGYGSAEKDLKQASALSETDRKIAGLRAQVLQVYGALGMNAPDFARAYSNGLIATDVRARLVELSPRDAALSKSKLYDWLERFAQGGVFALAHQYKERGGAGASLTQEQKDRLEWLWLDPNKPSVKQVVRILLDSYQLTIGERTACRYLNAIPKAVTDFSREGKQYYQNHYDLYIIRDYTVLQPLDVINGDYMTEDILCRKGERVFRARLCAFQDMRTRAILGWSLQETANSVGVVRALQMSFERYGLPKTIVFDNGKEFKNHWVCGDQWKMRHTKIDPADIDEDAGLLIELGINILFTQIKHGQSKPIERFWRTFHEQFDKTEATYLGSNTALRSDDAKKFRTNVDQMQKEDIEKIPTFEALEARIGHFFAWYNAKHEHSGQGMDGKTPEQVMAEHPYVRREIPADLKKYLFTLRYVKTVQRNGVLLDDCWYYAKEMTAIIGQRVEVRRGLDDVGTVHIFRLADKVPLFDAVCLEYSGNVQEDIAKKNKLKKEADALLKQYNRKQAEYDAETIKTPAEHYAEAEPVMLKVVNGEPLVFECNPPPLLTLVKTDKPKRRIRLPTDPD
jgi:putative transposase